MAFVPKHFFNLHSCRGIHVILAWVIRLRLLNNILCLKIFKQPLVSGFIWTPVNAVFDVAVPLSTVLTIQCLCEHQTRSGESVYFRTF